MGLSAQAMRNRGLIAVPLHGSETVTLPGAMAAFCRLSTDGGRFGRGRTLAPAIHHAEVGVPVVAQGWAAGGAVLKGDARRFYLLDGQFPKVGQIFHAPG